jgi:uncharacterized protein
LKYLVILIVVLAVFWALTRVRDRVPPPSQRKRPGTGADADATPAVMVRCEHCGLHLPRDEALPGPETGFYCSDAHRRLGPARRA